MKYIIVFLMLSSSLFSELIESNEGNSIVINHENSDDKYDNQLVVFEYIDTDKKRFPPIDVNAKAPLISETIDISNIIPNEHGHYILGINKGISKYTVSGLKPNREFIIHFIRQDKSPDQFVGLVRGSTNSLEPINSPSDIELVNMTNDKVELNWIEASDADGSILIVSKDRIPQLPKDADVYKPALEYGTNHSVTDGITYALFMGKKGSNSIIVDNITEDGIYYFQVMSYNGDYFGVNFNTNTNTNNTYVLNKGRIEE